MTAAIKKAKKKPMSKAKKKIVNEGGAKKGGNKDEGCPDGLKKSYGVNKVWIL